MTLRGTARRATYTDCFSRKANTWRSALAGTRALIKCCAVGERGSSYRTTCVTAGSSRPLVEANVAIRLLLIRIVSVGRPSGSYLVDSHPKETRAIMRRSNLHSRDRPGLYSSARWQLQFEAWFTSPSLKTAVLG